MTHLEAQSYIMPFIEGKVPSDKQEDFVIHMRNCSKCHKELEIYYTLLVGMKQLDNNKMLSTDFNRDLERDLRSMSQHVKGRRRFKVSAFSVVMTITIIIISGLYAGALNKVYNFEQRTKEYNQGDYYFTDVLGEGMASQSIDNIDRVEDSARIEEESQLSAFDRISGYIRLEEDYRKIINVGEDIASEASID